MKKLIIVASVAIVTLFACQKTELLTPKNSSENIALSQDLNSTTTSTAPFNVALISDNVVNGSNFEWIWQVTAGTTKTGLSHFNFTDFTICQNTSLKDALVGAAYSTDGINWTTSTVNWAEDKSQQSGCSGTDKVMKIDVGASSIYYKLILNEEFGVGENNAEGVFKRGGGSKKERDAGYKDCGFLNFDGPTCLPEEEICYEWRSETAWSWGTRYVSQGNWATYTSYSDLTNGVTIYAGQTIDIGTAKLGDDGIITITLKDGWELQNVSESVKIEGYASVPKSENPKIGQFSNKGTSLTPTVGIYEYYGIHLDVRKYEKVTCP
jgi:hypothetical protein